jgi:hypothetical protein
MAASTKTPRERGDKGGLRPMLLAGGMGLMWFVKYQAGPLPVGVPGWGVALLFVGQLLADFVCAAVVVAVARLGLAMVRLSIANWRLQRGRGVE